MSIHFYCPLGHRLVVPDERAGKKGRCPVCQQKVYVPVADPRPSGRRKLAPSTSVEVEFESSPNVLPPPPPPHARGAANALDDILAAELGLGSKAPEPPPLAAPPREAPTFEFELPPPARTETPPRQPPPTTKFSSIAADESPLVRVRRNRWLQPVRAGMRVEALALDPSILQHVHLLAVAVLGAALLGEAPAIVELSSDVLPPWAAIALLLSGALGVVAIWIASIPDRSTLWMAMLLAALGAAAYAAAMAMTMAAPVGREAPLGLSHAGESAGLWCGANLLVLIGLGYALGRCSVNWPTE
ncbi:MAG TPA: hypothetical protein VHZ24_04670 [Pirellulales bacterium]|jgi:hypothetical protein|nr:hypothetical protein [Pirellulales bacterium]